MDSHINQEEFYKSLPKKRMAAGVLFFDDEGKVLLVKMSYKDGWGIPGGVVEENESPRSGAIREVKEELNLTIEAESLTLVCLGYIGKEGVKTESLQFTFYGGVLSPESIRNIVLPKDELTEFRFFEKKEGLTLLSNALLSDRVSKAFEAIENGMFCYIDR